MRSHICRNPIMTCHQLVKLTARRRVLIFEAQCFPGLRCAKCATNDFVVDSSEHVSYTGKKSSYLRITLRDVARIRGMQLQIAMLASQAIDSLGVRSLATNSPKDIGKVLLRERDLSLHGEF